MEDCPREFQQELCRRKLHVIAGRNHVVQQSADQRQKTAKHMLACSCCMYSYGHTWLLWFPTFSSSQFNPPNKESTQGKKIIGCHGMDD